jgi:hypothetical protein
MLIKANAIGSFQRALDRRICGLGSSSSTPTSRKPAFYNSAFDFALIEENFLFVWIVVYPYQPIDGAKTSTHFFKLRHDSIKVVVPTHRSRV